MAKEIIPKLQITSLGDLSRIRKGVLLRLLSPISRFKLMEKKINQIHSFLFYNELRLTNLQERLSIARKSQAYKNAYTSANPLVTVSITTHTSPNVLWERTLPSVLAQTYGNLDISISINVYNCTALEIAKKRLAELSDSRVRINEVIGPLPSEQLEIPTWENSGTLEATAGIQNSRGEWISIFSHDDLLEPNAISKLVATAVEQKLEFCYGDFVWVRENGDEIICSNPPQHGRFNLQGSILNGALNFFTFSATDAILGVPNDWGA